MQKNSSFEMMRKNRYSLIRLHYNPARAERQDRKEVWAVKILWAIFKSSFLRFFPKTASSEWLEEGGECDEHSFCANTLIRVVRQKGRRWLVPVNLALFLPGLLLLAADDHLRLHTRSFLVRLCALTVAFFFLILKFDVWRLRDEKNILKLMYIFSMSYMGGYAAVTYLFLAAFENIAAYGVWGGI